MVYKVLINIIYDIKCNIRSLCPLFIFFVLWVSWEIRHVYLNFISKALARVICANYYSNMIRQLKGISEPELFLLK